MFVQFVMTQLQTINKKLWSNFNKIQLSKKMHEFKIKKNIEMHRDARKSKVNKLMWEDERGRSEMK